jgi:hypothetical protein
MKNNTLVATNKQTNKRLARYMAIAKTRRRRRRRRGKKRKRRVLPYFLH